jgi:predicted nucleic acid-binding Zn ribbon protein
MPYYEFRCAECGSVSGSTDRAHAGPCGCGGPLRRIWHAPGFIRGTAEHFNHSLGSYVRDDKDFRQQLRVKSAEMSERLGMPVDYQPADLSDRKALGVSGQADELRGRKDYAQGKEPARRYFA